MVAVLPSLAAVPADIEYKTVGSPWSTGYQGEIQITYRGEQPLQQWELSFALDHEIESIWNASLVGNQGQTWSVTGPSWSPDLQPGQTVNIGFIGKKRAEDPVSAPRDFQLQGNCPGGCGDGSDGGDGGDGSDGADGGQDQVVVTFVRTSNWDNGFNADIRITNPGPEIIDGWELSFGFEPQITQLWNGTLRVDPGPVYVVTHLDWNAQIAPGASVTLGFGATGTFSQSVTDCTLNDGACDVRYEIGGGGGGGTPTAFISLEGVDDDATFTRIDGQGNTGFTLSLTNGETPEAFTAMTNNADVLGVRIEADHRLVVTPRTAGFAGIRIEEAGGGVRHIGIAVRETDGSMPGLPGYLAVGSVSEDSNSHLSFFRNFEEGDRNRRVDIRYIYLNGGPVNGWVTWTNVPGDRARRYIRESQKLGIIPFFIYYNVPDGGESYETDKAHLQDPEYMAGYYRDLKLALDIIAEEADGWPIGMLLEPDFIGYMAQNRENPDPLTFPDAGPGVAARTDAAYTTDDRNGEPILVRGEDPDFPASIRGFVESVNYLIRKHTPDTILGWQFNLWASPPGGHTGTPIPGSGLIHKTDTEGFEAGRVNIYNEAAAITQYYLNSGVASYQADFVSIDKYGLDAVGQNNGAAQNPEASIWFWNADHWMNYLIFCRAMRETAQLPVILWQIPVGHINTSEADNPYADNGRFTPLSNQHQRWEDSAGTFFLGDTFNTERARLDFFSRNQGGDAKVSREGNRVTWLGHMEETADAGVIAVLFGAGVGTSTQGTPPSGPTDADPTDDYWWIVKLQRYLMNPVALPQP